MSMICIGTATPPFAITLEDRFQIAENFVIGDAKERMFTPYIIEKSTVERRHLSVLNASTGTLAERQTFFPNASECLETGGPSTGERMIAYEEHATALAKAAVMQTFEQASIKPSDITHTVTASCTGFNAPGVDIDLIREFSMAPTTQRTHVGFMGCHAGLNALRVANAYAKADPDACILVSATELCGLHYQYIGKNDQKVANALFADGAASAIILGDNWKKQVPANSWRIAATGSMILPESAEYMTWKVRDNGFTMSLSDRIPKLIEEHLQSWMSCWLAKSGLKLEDVATWAVHPGGPQILNAFERSMSPHTHGVQYSRDVLKENGNMSSATVFFIMQRMMKAQEKVPCVALGFGPGITIEATLFLPA
jgi:predicted naringenin-chalcone synthase